MKYLNWNEKTLPAEASPANIEKAYEAGYVFTRINKGVMHQTRSVRVNLSKFTLSSENRRIMKKVPLIFTAKDVPLADYHWSLGKLAKDFYETKFGPDIFSAQKVKEILTDSTKSNFNKLFGFKKESEPTSEPLGFCISHQTPAIIHYSYPFYDLEKSTKDMGLSMMTHVVEAAAKADMQYVYLGSLQRPSDTYKLQFEGIEWFDGEKWNTSEKEAKAVLAALSNE